MGTFFSGGFAYSSLDIPLISKTWVLGWVLMLMVGRGNSSREANAVCSQLKGNHGEVEVGLIWGAYKTRIQSQGTEQGIQVDLELSQQDDSSWSGVEACAVATVVRKHSGCTREASRWYGKGAWRSQGVDGQGPAVTMA